MTTRVVAGKFKQLAASLVFTARFAEGRFVDVVALLGFDREDVSEETSRGRFILVNNEVTFLDLQQHR